MIRTSDAGGLYLVWHDAPGAGVSFGDPSHALNDAMYLVRSARTRSQIYHEVKRQLPRDAALLAAPLAEAPKFKGLAPGALAWLRSGP